MHIKFVDGSDLIAVGGPRDAVFAVQKDLTDTVMELVWPGPLYCSGISMLALCARNCIRGGDGL